MIVSILNPPHEKTDCKITKAVNRYTTLLYKWLNNYCCIDIKKNAKVWNDVHLNKEQIEMRTISILTK